MYFFYYYYESKGIDRYNLGSEIQNILAQVKQVRHMVTNSSRETVNFSISGLFILID